MLKRYKIRDYDFGLVIMVLTLTVIGILAVGSAKASMQSSQILGLILGFFFMILLSLFDYSFFLNFYWLIYIFNLILLIGVELFGKTVNNAQRWIVILGIQFQPSETAKIMLILFYAQFIMKNKKSLNTFKTLFLSFVLLVPPLYLVYRQPDLKTTIMLALIFGVIIFIGGLSYKIIFSVLAVLVPAAIIFLSIVLQPDQNLIKEYQQTRILAWLHPAEYATTEGYQQTNAITAIGSGQLFGKGLNNNIISSVKNGNFISEPQTDFIFAVIGEELGFIGGCAVIVLLFLITMKLLMIAKKSKDLAGTLICSGMAAIIGFQSFINISVATGILPNTGVPLPFVSYGLTSLVSLFIGMGFVLNIRLQSTKKY
ncbi:MAG: FtsW/RodA/SpoVE family cell cycle protein [Lachnospiraceae bacterium]|nr:FtsW/RodA/SpoVE family cell cycle protein [Lachnospiraceae bacterium]MDD3659321.1 FtsW/RodA/SpoVE family cell cycle protein [Lachnospiraceae bacterium]